jgi:glucose-6-phosphate isomerase
MSWQAYNQQLVRYPHLGFSLDCSLMEIPADFFETMQPQVAKAMADIAALESGAIANPDEKRMVGHYWLRKPSLAPTQEIRDAIT